MDGSVWGAAPSAGPPAAWFFSAASGKPALADVPARGEWLRFCRSDCAALEARYASRPEAYDAEWSRQAAEEAAAPGPAPAPPPLTAQPRDAAGERPVLVRSGLHEVCLPTRTCWPAYYDTPSRGRVLRATWFLERNRVWEPCGTQLAELLEVSWRNAIWTQRQSQPGSSGLLAARVNLAGAGLQPGLHALFLSEHDAFLVQDTLPAKLQHAMGPLVSGGEKGAPGLRLRRGWREEAASPLGEEEQEDERAAHTPPTHLVMLTHGIGHRLEFVDIAQDTAALRKTARGLAAQHVPAGAGRLVALPVQWRKSLDLRAERQLDAITPDAPSLRPIRQVLNALVLDVLSYWTPTAQEMTDALTAALNAQVERFAARCPGFTGQVSLVAHSLGSVLAWDILCNQPDTLPDDATSAFAGASSSSDAYGVTSAPPMLGMGLGMGMGMGMGMGFGGGHDTASSEEWTPGGGDPRVHALQRELAEAKRELAAARTARSRVYHPLRFRLHTLVLLGSPLGLFLALQDNEKGSGDGSSSNTADAPALLTPAVGGRDGLLARPPACSRIINVLHPHDPVAYRLEPLLAPSAAPARPALVPWHRNGGRRLGVELADRVEALSTSLRSMGALSSAALSRFGLSMRNDDTAAAAAAANSAAASAPLDAPRVLLRRLAGVGAEASDDMARVDFALQTAETEIPIIQAFTAHLAYWSDPDVALVVLRACGPAPDVPPLPAAAPGGGK